MAAKSYVPQLIRMLNRLCVYVAKHQSTFNAYLTPAQQAAVQSVVSACQAFGAVPINEQP